MEEKFQSMTFGEAIEAMKDGYIVAREGWREHEYIWLMPEAEIKAEWCREPHLKALAEANGGTVRALGSIRAFIPFRGVMTGWVPSQEEMMANDWTKVGVTTPRDS